MSQQDAANRNFQSGNILIQLALIGVIQAALAQAGLPQAAVQYIDDPDRALVRQLLRLDAYVDMIVPRGGDSALTPSLVRTNPTVSNGVRRH